MDKKLGEKQHKLKQNEQWITIIKHLGFNLTLQLTWEMKTNIRCVAPLKSLTPQCGQMILVKWADVKSGWEVETNASRRCRTCLEGGEFRERSDWWRHSSWAPPWPRGSTGKKNRKKNRLFYVSFFFSFFLNWFLIFNYFCLPHHHNMWTCELYICHVIT